MENQVWIRQRENGGPETAELIVIGNHRLTKYSSFKFYKSPLEHQKSLAVSANVVLFCGSGDVWNLQTMQKELI